jgi:hypothetical protein
MRKSCLAATLAIGFLAGGSAFAETPRTVPAASLSMPQVFEKLSAQGYWNIDRIERESTSFEVIARDKSGARVKLHVDARSGEILDRREEGRKHDKRHLEAGQRDGVECNERRCRDDLPPKS